MWYRVLIVGCGGCGVYRYVVYASSDFDESIMRGFAFPYFHLSLLCFALLILFYCRPPYLKLFINPGHMQEVGTALCDAILNFSISEGNVIIMHVYLFLVCCACCWQLFCWSQVSGTIVS